jgi:hypothetical protein
MATPTPTSNLSTMLGPDPSVERLFDNVQAVVPAVGLAMVKLAAWNTIEEFYIQSTFCREHLFWKMAGGVQTIDFNPFSATELVAWVLSYKGLSRGKIEPPGVLRDLTFPASTEEREGEAWLALKPVSFDAVNCGCSQELWSSWFEPVLDGTLGRLYSQPAKPYSSPQLAQYHMRRYRAGIARARDVANRGFTNGVAWRFPYFAGGGRRT